jgi:thioredoxin-like negative regulator of GroEL
MSFGQSDLSIGEPASPFLVSGRIREIEASEFDIEVVQRSRTTPIVACFGAPWSSPSRAVLGTIESYYSGKPHPPQQASGDQRAC